MSEAGITELLSDARRHFTRLKAAATGDGSKWAPTDNEAAAQAHWRVYEALFPTKPTEGIRHRLMAATYRGEGSPAEKVRFITDLARSEIHHRPLDKSCLTRKLNGASVYGADEEVGMADPTVEIEGDLIEEEGSHE